MAAAATATSSFAIRRFAFAALFGAGLAVLGGAAAPGTAAAGEWHGGSGYGGQHHRPYYRGGWGGAAAATPGLGRHRWAQQERWQRYGRATSRISPWESRRIDRAQAGLARHEGWARADGVVTWRERRELSEHARRVDGLIARSMQNGYGYRSHGHGW